MLMMIMYKNYSIRSRSFQSLDSIERKAKPMKSKDGNPVLSMFDTAGLLLPTIHQFNAKRKNVKILNIVEGNMKIINILCDHITEVDLDRRQMLRDEWELKTKSIVIEKCGRKIVVQPEK